MTPAFLDLLWRIATAYDALAHTPDDALITRAYTAFKATLLRQYATIPYRVLFVDTDPYGPVSADMFRMVEASGILRVYTGSDMPKNHPMSESAGTLMQGSGIARKATYNHVFRAVHDALVHIPNRLSFSAVGEFKAFQAHARLICGLCALGEGRKQAQLVQRPCSNAIRALATETLAQNAWFNTFGQGKTYPTQTACLLPDSLIIEALEFRP